MHVWYLSSDDSSQTFFVKVVLIIIVRHWTWVLCCFYFSGKKVWDEVAEHSKEFIQEYLEEFPNVCLDKIDFNSLKYWHFDGNTLSETKTDIRYLHPYTSWRASLSVSKGIPPGGEWIHFNASMQALKLKWHHWE